MSTSLSKLKFFKTVKWGVVVHSVANTTSFIVLLTLYLANTALMWCLKQKFTPNSLKTAIGQKVTKVYDRLAGILDKRNTGTISRRDLIELSLRNMRAKKTRTLITIGGMTIGIGSIVFLVSIGYGLQQLVVTRVARLDEIRQADISPQTGGNIKITDKTLADIKAIPQVETVLPLIAVVGRINYQNSVTDVAVYGVTSDYLNQSAIKAIEGKIFESNDLAINSQFSGKVEGASSEQQIAEFGSTIRKVDVAINPDEWVRVRSGPSTKSSVLGFSRRQEGTWSGEEVWGRKYTADTSLLESIDTNGNPLMPWVKVQLPLWEKKSCDVNEANCEAGNYQKALDESDRQVMAEGYIAEINIQINSAPIQQSKVLGESTEWEEASEPEVLASESAIIDSGVGWVEIASEAGVMAATKVQTVNLADSAQRKAVVNRAMLKVLGLKEQEAVGKTVSTSFVIIGDLMGSDLAKTESAPAEYQITGVVPDDKSPVMYIPFTDLRGLGVVNYSQVKLAAKDSGSLEKIRITAESMGFTTRSVADTVNQINSLFGTIRTVLALLGMVALGVASLGMFNTLTVSLLERTREVGLMKAMGMKSTEVKELFLTESMIMGFFGGTIGVAAGFLAGKLLGLLLSVFAVVKGVGFVDVSYVPLGFVAVVIGLSLMVGVLTGIYPARRATKISALNALRYE